MGSIEDRLRKLEAEIIKTRRLAFMSIIIAAGLLLTVLVAATEDPDIIRAKEFIVEDEAGQVRAGLVMTDDGPMCFLVGENGMRRVCLSVLAAGPLLLISDQKPDGGTVGLGVVEGGRPSLVI